MRAWALILIAYFIGAFLLRDNFSVIFSASSEAWWIAMISIGLVATAFADPIRNLMGFLSEDRHRALFALLTVFCIFSIEYITTSRDTFPTHSSQTGSAALAVVQAQAEVNRSWDGHFRAIAQVNGADVGLMIDTGASLVLLRHDDAIRMGIKVNELNYSTPLTTASGKSFVAPMVIETLTIGDLTVHEIKAAVAQDGALHSSLLGMSFLEKLSETVIQKGRMILRK